MGTDTEVLQTEELKNCLKALKWNERFLRLFGVWPLKVYDPLFALAIAYLFLHCALAIIDIPNYANDADSIVGSLAEILLAFSTLIRLLICRMSQKTLTEFISEIQDDFTTKNYRNKKEISTFVSYNRMSFLFVVIVIPCTGTASIGYYSRLLGINIKMVLENSSFGHQLPYKVRPVVPLDDITVYALYCMYQALLVVFVTFAYTGYDSFFVTLSLHVIGQFSVLNYRVKEVLNEPDSYRHEIKNLIVRHKRLIRNENECFKSVLLYSMIRRLADILEDGFNLANLQQFLITMWNLCMTGYNILVTSSNSHGAKLVIFAGFAVTALITVFIYCYIGEGLTQESLKFGEAFYDTDWYNISQTELKTVLICMLRSSKPLQLTSGKFTVLSLNTFTNIIKTTAGYFSLMRTLL